jgi:ribosomal protein S25
MKKYPSKYSNGKEVTAAQFITELICERLAKKIKKDLHYRFWLSKEWEKQYKGQIGTANKLLQKYDPKNIIDALLSKEGLKIYSLRAPHLCGIIEKQVSNAAKTVKKEPVIRPIERNSNSKGQVRNNKTNKNIIDILEDIDNGSSKR